MSGPDEFPTRLACADPMIFVGGPLNDDPARAILPGYPLTTPTEWTVHDMRDFAAAWLRRFTRARVARAYLYYTCDQWPPVN
jgi:hypothetical protein